MRKHPPINENYYHIINRSIAKYQIFNNDTDYNRMLIILDLYRFTDFNYKYSAFHELSAINQKNILDNIKQNRSKLVEIISYCLMPTHIHLILKQIEDGGISKYMAKVLNSYSRYFNLKHNRKGPLWEGRFKNILIGSDEQLLHLTRYIHLNPSSTGLVNNPEKWEFSSYQEYLGKARKNICKYQRILRVNPKKYKKFVSDRIDYQKEISKIKHLVLDDYSG